MFCDGKCKTKKKTCGLYVTETLQQKVSGDIKTEEKCILMAMLGVLYRIEQQNVGLHAAANSTRNEAAKQSSEVQATLAHGFLGLVSEIRKSNSIEVLDGGQEPRLALK